MTTTNFSARPQGPPSAQRWATARHRLAEQLRAIDGSRAVIATAALADTARPARLDADQSSLVAALTHTFSELLEAGDQLATTHHDPEDTDA